MDQETTIRPDGKIRAVEIGEVDAGRTATELAELLVQRSSQRLRDPEVVVNVTHFSQRSVYVAGEVGRPGTIPYRKDLTPLQAVIEAGGFVDTAKPDQVVLTRMVGRDGRTLTRTINLEKAMNDGAREPIHLAPHDVLYVPRTGVAEANIWVDQHVTRLFPFFRGAGARVDTGIEVGGDQRGGHGRRGRLADEADPAAWRFQTGSAIHGRPITYMVGERRYVSVPSGWGRWVAGIAPSWR